mmetsp:Transcript_13358/g.26403  ORF Transcript_13358/g.26403 Transcript_13358/m.26403 type:complete len:124 (+) Transcript_13358:142-513(+)
MWFTFSLASSILRTCGCFKLLKKSTSCWALIKSLVLVNLFFSMTFTTTDRGALSEYPSSLDSALLLVSSEALVLEQEAGAVLAEVSADAVAAATNSFTHKESLLASTPSSSSPSHNVTPTTVD